MLRLSVFCLTVSLLPFQPVPESRSISVRESSIAVKKALEELSRQSGVVVRDDRGVKDDAISLDLDRVSFWQALDTIAARAKGRVVLGRDGVLSLGSSLPDGRVPPTSYDGEFRTRVLRVTTARDLDSGRGSCVFTLGLVWTPTLRPLYIDSLAHDVRLLDSKNKAVSPAEEGGSLAAVDGRSSFTVEVTAPALPRSEARVALLEGKLNAVVPSKFLAFRFDADLATLKDAVADGAVRRLVQDEVVCRVERVVLDKERWSVRLALDYPPGGKELESFQAGSLVVNNELVLASADGKRSLAPAGYVIDSVSSRRAVVTYHFSDKPGARRGAAEQWKPRYSAPARIVEVPVHFRFRDVPLP
jgi:hypothetical protein